MLQGKDVLVTCNCNVINHRVVFCELDFLLMEIVSTDYDDVMDTKRALNGKHICFVLSSCRAFRGNILELIDLLENREEVRCTVKR